MERFLEQLTIELIRVPSINGTYGEVEIIDLLERKVRELPYFARYEEQVWTQELKEDLLGRKNLFALIKGEKGNSSKTVILHAHCDTVTVNDYGEYKHLAFDPFQLAEQFQKLNVSEEVKDDLASGDWLFGRGSLDMKSGIAVHLWIVNYLSERVSAIEGNLLFMINPVEETTHGGVIAAVEELTRLKSEMQLDLVTAINTDFVGPLYAGDQTKYLYVGSVGKLLPSFLIRGKETHVGQPYEGFDPNYLAAELIQRIELNPEFCDFAAGELTAPPTVLKMKDLKSTYNVQTPLEAFLYFNYFVHGNSPTDVLKQLKKAAQEAFEETIRKINQSFERYCQRASKAYVPLPWQVRVVSFSELYDEVNADYGGNLQERLLPILDEYAGKEDLREVTLRMVQEVLKLCRDQSPVIVMFYCAPYCPRNYVKGKNDNEKKLLSVLDRITSENENLKRMNYFPYLSDSSYFSMDDTDREIKELKENFPGMDRLYPVPVQSIRSLDIPAITMGVWGKDAHKMTERLYKPYAFRKLPLMILSLALQMMGNNETID